MSFLHACLLWLIEREEDQKPKNNHFFGPENRRINPTAWMVTLKDDDHHFYLPSPNYDHANPVRNQKNYGVYDNANADDRISQCIFMIPEDLDQAQKDWLSNHIPKKVVRILDKTELECLFEKHLQKPISITSPDFIAVMELIDVFHISYGDNNWQAKTEKGKHLTHLLTHFTPEISLRILEKAKELKVDDLFEAWDYSQTSAVVLCGDITNFTAIMANATETPVKIGRFMKAWYEQVSEIVRTRLFDLALYSGKSFPHSLRSKIGGAVG